MEGLFSLHPLRGRQKHSTNISAFQNQNLNNFSYEIITRIKIYIYIYVFKTLHLSSFVISLTVQGISLTQCFHNVLVGSLDAILNHRNMEENHIAVS